MTGACIPIARVFKETLSSYSDAELIKAIDEEDGDSIRAAWLFNAYRKSTFFDVQTAMDLVGNAELDRAADLGNLRLPFDSVWMEWEVNGVDVRMACLAHALNPDEVRRKFGQDRRAFDVLMLTQTPTDPSPLVKNIDTVVVTDEVGRFVEYAHASRTHTRDMHWHERFLDVGMMALSLINCRNVTTKANYVNMRRSGAQKRRGEPAPKIKYSTILLPNSGSDGSNDQITGTTRLHRVRGHFATYTAEAPLFGKLTGTFWRPWHLAGNPDRGVIESDYRLKA